MTWGGGGKERRGVEPAPSSPLSSNIIVFLKDHLSNNVSRKTIACLFYFNASAFVLPVF